MRPFSLHYFPLALPFAILFLLLVALLITMIEIGIVGYAYEKMGINRRYVFTLLLLSLLGSSVNIPIAELPAERVLSSALLPGGRRPRGRASRADAPAPTTGARTAARIDLPARPAARSRDAPPV